MLTQLLRHGSVSCQGGFCNLTPRSPAHVHVQEGEHIGLPNFHAEKGKSVPIVGRLPDWWIDLEQMRFAELLQPRVQRCARCDRVVIRGMNKEYRHSSVLHGREKSRPQLRRPIPAITGYREDYDRPQLGLALSHKQRERSSKRVPDHSYVVRIDLREGAQERESGKGIAHVPALKQLELECVPRLLPVCGGFNVHQVDGVLALIGGQADAAPEQEQEHISMASERGSE